MSRIEKGTYGYRDQYKKRQIGYMSFFGALILVGLGVRFFADFSYHTALGSIAAVLAAIPLANILSPFVVLYPWKTMKKEDYDQYSARERDFRILYDLIITTKEDVMVMDVLVVHPTGIYGWCTNPKVVTDRAEDNVNNTLAAMHLDPNFHVIKDRKVFDKRFDSLKPASEYEDDGTVDYAVEVLEKISV
ncbi:O-linked GlcNAc transferase-like protein [[Clostridium] aminophilum]|uniref:O-linked GlcNAc transferase-like protein n=1 Tax=[Clostridium] aminophilum TaxID=1526 RepID=UPI0026ECE95B|nr:O-linked GlcNAc transferase-like protein [[Clostridium] aminophilum]MDD6196154.1 O-linked GlcNAc transferase-like protein [[Clostridium] aminophilum]